MLQSMVSSPIVPVTVVPVWVTPALTTQRISRGGGTVVVGAKVVLVGGTTVVVVVVGTVPQPVGGAGMMSRPSWCLLCASTAFSLTVISLYGFVTDPVA